MKGQKTTWTSEMTAKLQAEFPYRFSRDIGNELGLSIRTVIRKARELGLAKEDLFFEKNRTEISKRAQDSRPENPTKGMKGWFVPNAEKNWYKPGHVPQNNPEKTRETRNETIRKEKVRIKYGLPQKTKMKLTNIY